MELKELIQVELSQVRASVLSQSPNFTFIDIQQTPVDSVNKRVTFNVRFKYNSMPVVITLEHYLNTVNPEAFQRTLTDIVTISRNFAKNLVLMMNTKINDAKAYSILYNSNRAIHFIIPVRFSNNKVIEYTINIRRGSGVVYHEKLKYASGQINLENQMIKLNAWNFSTADKLTITTVQNIISNTFSELTKNENAKKLILFLTQLTKGVNYIAFIDNTFVGTLTMNSIILYTSQGIDPKSSITINKGTEMFKLQFFAVLNAYKSLSEASPNEKIKKVSLMMYKNQLPKQY